jgi:hypothetical protein
MRGEYSSVFTLKLRSFGSSTSLRRRRGPPPSMRSPPPPPHPHSHPPQVFAFDRTVSRLLEMQSQDYLKTQYSEWLQRRSSSKGLLTSLLQSEPSSDQRPDLDPLSLPSLTEDTPFVPQFQLDALSLESLRETLVTEMERQPSSELTIAHIVCRTIERLADIRLGEATGSSPKLKPQTSADDAAQVCHSAQGGLVLLSADQSFRIATSSPSDHRRRR